MFKVSLKRLHNAWPLNRQAIPVIVLVAPKSNCRAAAIQLDGNLHAKYRDRREADPAQADGEEGKEAFVRTRQSGVGSEKCEPHDAGVQTKFELAAECREQVENPIRVSGAGTGSSALGTDAAECPERR